MPRLRAAFFPPLLESRGTQNGGIMEHIMDDQTLWADEELQAETVIDLARKLREREQHLLERLQEAQTKEARAQERLRRAEARLQRRRTRLERINSYLTHVRRQIADLQVTDWQPEQVDAALGVPVTSEPASMNGSEVTAPSIQTETEITPATDSAPAVSGTSEPEVVPAADSAPVISNVPEPEVVPAADSAPTVSSAPEPEPAPVADSAPVISNVPEPEPVPAADSAPTVSSAPEPEVAPIADSAPVISNVPEPEAATPADGGSAAPDRPDVEVDATPEFVASPEQVVVSSDSEEQAHDTAPEREVTTTLGSGQETALTSASFAQAAALAKEAWVAAENEVQHARTTAHNMAASISFLSQKGGLSNELMAELLRKQSEANKALSKAQNAARAAYEKFVHAQEEADRAEHQQANGVIDTADNLAQQNQENGASPVEDNAEDDTGKMRFFDLHKAE